MLKVGTRAGGFIAALLILLTTMTPVQAVDWDTGPFQVSGPGAATSWSGSVAFPASTTGSILTAVSYREDVGGVYRVLYRRSAGGQSWDAPVQLSRAGATHASRPSLSSLGSTVDAVWVEGTADGTTKVVHRRSSDAGATWSSATALSPNGTTVGFPKVARDDTGRVLVVYTDEKTGKIWMRLSTDGGTSFAARIALATTSNRPWDGETLREGFPSVAVARGVFHVALYRTAHELVVRRSVNGAATWTSPRTVTSAGSGYFPQIVASGRTVLIGYAAASPTTWYAAYRRSTDKGVAWSGEVALSSKKGNATFAPVLSAVGGQWTAAFERCSNAACSSSVARVRTSSDGGASFLAATTASHAGVTYAWPVGSAFTGNWVTVYATYTEAGGVEGVWSVLGH